MQDAVSKGRLPLGEARPNSKLTARAVRQIRDTYARGRITQAELAKRYEVCLATVNSVVNRTTWTHV